MSEAPTCCGHPMDENLGGWTCMKCGHHVRPYPDDPETEPDPYAVNPDPYAISPDLSLELDEARARIEELEAERDEARQCAEAEAHGLDAINAHLAAARARIAALEAERDALAQDRNTSMSSCADQLAASRAQVAQAHELLHGMNARIAELEIEHYELLQSLGRRNAHIEELEAERNYWKNIAQPKQEQRSDR